MKPALIRRLPLLPLVLALTGAETAPASPAPLPVQGDWQLISTIEGVTYGKKAPAELVERINQGMAESGGPPPLRRCTAAPLDQAEGLFHLGNDGCVFDHYGRANGRLSFAMRCTNDRGVTDFVLSGPYSANSIELSGTITHMVAGAAGNEPAVTIAMAISGQRLGDCQP